MTLALKRFGESADSFPVRSSRAAPVSPGSAIELCGERIMAIGIRASERFEEESGHATPARRAADVVGLACLVAALLLLSSGVRTSRADDAAEANMSVDPKLTAELEAVEAERPRAIARPGGPAAQPGIRPGVAGVEIAPGVIRLNTRGYNYRPATGGVDTPPAMPAPGAPPSVPAAPAPSAAPNAEAN